MLVSLFIFTFSSCTIKINTPEIPQSFNQNAVVTSGDFSFECEICKNEEIVSVKVKNTNALGLIMIYDGNTVNFKYDEYYQGIIADTEVLKRLTELNSSYDENDYIRDYEKFLAEIK